MLHYMKQVYIVLVPTLPDLFYYHAEPLHYVLNQHYLVEHSIQCSSKAVT